MKELTLLRHAEALASSRDDRSRELSQRGRGQARALGEALRERGFSPGAVLRSPAARAGATAEILLGALGLDPEVVVAEGLYGASAGEMAAIVAAEGGSAESLLVVGHNPGIEALASALGGKPLGMGTCGCVILRFSCGSWAEAAAGRGLLSAEMIRPS